MMGGSKRTEKTEAGKGSRTVVRQQRKEIKKKGKPDELEEERDAY